jgi:hypothetical protein
MRAPSQVNGVVNQDETGAFVVLRRIKEDEASGTIVSGAGILGVDENGAVVNFAAIGGVEGVQALVIVAGSVFRHGDNKDRRIPDLGPGDDGCCSDSDLRVDLRTSAIVGGGLASFEGADLPKDRTGVSVIGINGAVLGDNNQEIVVDSGNGDGREIKRLGIDDPIRGNDKELSETCGVYVVEG